MVIPSLSISSCSRARSAGVGSASGERPAIPSTFSPNRSQVGERVVRDHDRVPRAALQPLLVVGRELVEVGDQGLARWRRRSPRGPGRPSTATPRPRSVSVAIRAGSCQKCGSFSPASSVESFEVDHVRHVEHVALGDLADRVVDGRLEAVLEQHQVGVRDLGGRLDVELQVVRLVPRLGQVGDVHVVPADPLRHERQRVERRRHRHLPVVPRCRRRTPRSPSSRAAGR